MKNLPPAPSQTPMTVDACRRTEILLFCSSSNILHVHRTSLPNLLDLRLKSPLMHKVPLAGTVTPF